MENKNNWASWVDNQPTYKEGDLAVFGYPIQAGFITCITKEVISEYDKEQRSEYVKKRKPCFVNKGRGVIENLNSFSYTINNSEIIASRQILGIGIDFLNKEIIKLNDEYDSLSKRVSKAASELGYGDNDY